MTAEPHSLKLKSVLSLPTILGDLADFNFMRYGEYVQLYYEDREYTNTQLADQSRRLASGLLSLGIKAGDRVLVMMVNSPEVLITYQAVLRMGAVVVPLLPVLKSSEIGHIAANCVPKAAIINTTLFPVVAPAFEAAGIFGQSVIIGAGDPVGAVSSGITGFEELISTNSPYAGPSQGKPEDLAIIIYTSGTTGKPKGVMLSHKNKMTNLLAGISDKDHLLGRTNRPKEPGLAALPLAHAYGLTVSNLSYLSGDPLVMMQRFETKKAFELIQKHKIVNMGAVPAMLVAMLNYPGAEIYDTSTFRNVVSGSAPLPVSVLEGFQARFGATIREGYGLSEATTSVSGHKLGLKIKSGSVGVPNESNEVQIFDSSDNPVIPYERGEVVVKGENVMMGYYNNPAATADVIRNGWLYTGDVGYKDEEGYIYIVERKKDLIIRNGQNVYPRDSEEVLAQHPAVMETAVVGVPSNKYGEEVKAYVVLRSGHNVTAGELMAFCQQFLADYKTPSQIEFVEALPRNTVGKINKRALREIAK